MDKASVIEKLEKYNQSLQMEEAWHETRKNAELSNYLITDGKQRIAFTNGQGEYRFDTPDVNFKPTTLGDEWQYLNLTAMQQELDPRLQSRFYSDTDFIRDALLKSEPGVNVSQTVYAKDQVVYAQIKNLGINDQLKDITNDLLDLAQQGVAIDVKRIPAEIIIEMGAWAVNIENNPSFSEDSSKDLREALKEVYPDVFGISMDEAFERLYPVYNEEIADDIKGYRDYNDSSIAENDQERFFEMVTESREIAKLNGCTMESTFSDVVLDYIYENDWETYDFSSLESSKSYESMRKAVSALTLEEEDNIDSELTELIRDSDIGLMAENLYVDEYAQDILCGKSNLIEFRVSLLGDLESVDDAYYPESISNWNTDHFKSLAQMMKLVNADGKELYKHLVDNEMIDANNDIKAVLNFKAKEGKSTSLDSIIEVIENSYGGNATLFGFMDAANYAKLDLSKPIELSGNIQFGIYDDVNGSGYLTDTGVEKIVIPANFLTQSNVREGSWGYNVDDTFGYVKSAVQVSAKNVELTVEKNVKKGVEL